MLRSQHNFNGKKKVFLRVYKQRDKFRYIIEKGTQGKNQVIRDLSSCIIKKCNGYDTIKIEMKNPEKNQHEPIDIVYVPIKKG